MIPLDKELLKVDTNLKKNLHVDHETEFFKKFRLNQLGLPKGDPIPFVLYYTENRVALLWAMTRSDFIMWTEAFKSCQQLSQES